MYVAIQDPSLDYAEPQWFPPPFGLPTTCRPLEEWKKTKHYKQIDPSWSITWCNQVLDDYTKTVKDWLELQLRKRQDSKSRASIYPANFSLAESKHTAEELEALQKAADEDEDSQAAAEALRVAKLQRELDGALLYFATYVLDDTLKQSLWAQNQIAASDGSGQTGLTWTKARAIITWGLKAEDPLGLLTRLLTERRPDRLTLYRWISTLMALRVRLEQNEVRLPESFYLKLIDRQMMSNERRLVASWLSETGEDKTLMATWYKIANQHDDTTVCPTFRVSAIKRELKSIPERPTRVSQPKAEKPEKAGEDIFPGNGKRNKNKKNKRDKRKSETPKPEEPNEHKKPELRRSTRNKTQKSCYRCGGKDHEGPYDSKCPRHDPNWAKRNNKKGGKTRETFTVEEAVPPPTSNVSTIQEVGRDYVLVDFNSDSPHPVHTLQCGAFWRAKAGHSDWNVDGYKKYKTHLIQNRDDCAFATECCGTHYEKSQAKNNSISTPENDFECWMMGNRTTNTRTRSICRAKVDVEDRYGKTRTVTVALDTGSTTDVCLRQLATKVTDPSILVTRACGGETRLGPMVSVKILKRNKNPVYLTKVRVGQA